MSHIVTITTQIRDPVAIHRACDRMRLSRSEFGTHGLFSQSATGWKVQLPAWRYPVVCQTPSGQIHYDNFNGRWGDPKELERFMQVYAVEKTRLEAARQGYSVVESRLADGSIKLTLTAGEIA